MSTYQPIEAFEEDGTPTPDLAYVVSEHDLRESITGSTSRDQCTAVLSELCNPIAAMPIGVRPFPNPNQRAYGIQGLLNRPGEATPLGLSIWTAINAIFGVSSVIMIDPTTLGVNIGLAFTFDSIQDGGKPIHDQIMAILNEHTMLYPEDEVLPDPAQTLPHRIKPTRAAPDDAVITDLTDPTTSGPDVTSQDTLF